MIYWKLFLTFLEIGAVSFGGGYGMIAMIREVVLKNGWLTEEAFIDFIAVSESTPGPLAVNMATFVGSSQAGAAGGLAATLGVVLPAFLIILLIASLMKRLLQCAGVKAFLSGVRPCVVALICGTGVTMALNVFLNLRSLHGGIRPDWCGAVIFLILAAAAAVWKRLRGRSLPPVVLILISAGLGLLLYGALGAAA